MNSQNPNSSFPPVNNPNSLSASGGEGQGEVVLPPSTPDTRRSSHFWRIEPAPHADPALVKRSPWYAVQHVFCRRDTGEIVGIMRRLKGQFKTAWFSGNGVTVKRHYSMQAAKKFLERQFTRTVPSGSVWKTPHAPVAPEHPCKGGPRFNIIAFSTPPPRPCAGAQVIHVEFAAPRRSKFTPQIRANSRNSRITDH